MSVVNVIGCLSRFVQLSSQANFLGVLSPLHVVGTFSRTTRQLCDKVKIHVGGRAWTRRSKHIRVLYRCVNACLCVISPKMTHYNSSKRSYLRWRSSSKYRSLLAKSQLGYGRIQYPATYYSRVLRRRNRPAASLILENSMQNA